MAILDTITHSDVAKRHRPWPRALVSEEGWRQAIDQLATGRLVLLGLWGDAPMNDVPDGLTVWPEDDVARAMCNALTMATGALVTLREDQHLKNQGTYAIGVGYKPI